MKINKTDDKLKKAYRLLEEAERLFPFKTPTEAMQASEKVWGAWAQATKAYKPWRSDRGYDLLIGELYSKYAEYREQIRNAHRTARHLHAEGFYEGLYPPTKEDVEAVRRGVEIIAGLLDRR